MAASATVGFFAGSAVPHTTTETTTVTTPRLSGLLLEVSGNSSIREGANETLRVSLTNELPYSNNATFTGAPVLPQGPALSGDSWENFLLPIPPACGGYTPFYIAIYNQSGDPLQLNDSPPSLLTCVSSGSDFHVFNPSQVVSESFSVGGYWKGSNPNEPWVNATFTRLGKGTYTAIAFDPWSQVAELNFTVAAQSH